MRLLLVEDEAPLSRALTAILERNNYSVDPVFDGETALEYGRSGHYDGIILDVMLPKMDGFTVLRELRQSGISTPIIMLTAKSDVEDKVMGLDLGANDYLAKPFQSPELLARIRAMTRTQVTQVSSLLSVGNVTLDCASYEISTPHGSIRLTNKEFQMLEFFMRNPHTLISSDRLIEKIWGYDADTENNVVWVYISYLRKKFASLQANLQIRATRNAGYSLEELE